MDTPENIRKKIDRLILEKGLSLQAVSRQLGHADSYMQQYITRGYPQVLKEKDRVLLSRILDVPEQELTNIPLRPTLNSIKTIRKVGYVQAGKFNDACQLPETEWETIPYPVSEPYKNCHLYALGVRGDSMNLVFPPDTTTLICCPFEEWIEANPDTEIEGKYIIAYKKDAFGGVEATVKKYTKIDDSTIILVAESSNPTIKPIVLHPDNNEYDIAAVVIGDIRVY